MALQLRRAIDSGRCKCNYCGAHVTSDFRRSYGTDNRVAHRCPECDSWARIQRGSARGRTVDHPDPQNHQERCGGRELRSPVLTDGGER